MERAASRDSRREQNEKRFRRGNERLHYLVDGEVREATLIPFLCECADVSCMETVDVQLREWEEVASRPDHYIMVAGHPRSEGEEVVGSLREYDVVRKPA